MYERCTTGKVCHTSLASAKAAARLFSRTLNRNKVMAESMFAYRCTQCRRWHLTRQATYEGTENTLVHEAAPEELQRWAMGGMAL